MHSSADPLNEVLSSRISSADGTEVIAMCPYLFLLQLSPQPLCPTAAFFQFVVGLLQELLLLLGLGQEVHAAYDHLLL